MLNRRATGFFMTFILLLGALMLVQAETFTYPQQGGAKFKMDVPPGWKIEKMPENRTAFVSPSGAIKVIMVTAKGNADHGVNVLVAETEVTIKYDIKDSEILAGGFVANMPMQQKGLSATQLHSKGKRPSDGKPVAGDFVIFSPDRQLWVLLQAVYPVDAPKNEVQEFAAMINSIKRA